METINIIFSSDDRYAQHLGVALCSIFENKKDGYLINVYVLDGGILDINKSKLKILENKYNFKTNYIKIDVNLFENFYTTKHVTQAAYFRILIPKLLIDYKKILYFDCDVIITGDIFELYNIDIENYYFAAVEDYFIGQTRHEILNMSSSSRYFNSGVMLMNLEKLRKDNMCDKLFNFIKNNPDKIKFYDQDALNSVMYDKYLNISLKYNYISGYFDKDCIKYIEMPEDVLVIHYAGGKPWNFFDKNLLDKYYFQYLKNTPWRVKKYTDLNLKNILGHIYHSFI